MRGLIVGIGRKYSKPLAPCCITAACHTATHTRMWRGCPTEVSIPHGEFFLALGCAYPLFLLTAVPSTLSYPTPGLLVDIPLRQNWSAPSYKIRILRTNLPYITILCHSPNFYLIFAIKRKMSNNFTTSHPLRPPPPFKSNYPL